MDNSNDSMPALSPAILLDVSATVVLPALAACYSSWFFLGFYG